MTSLIEIRELQNPVFKSGKVKRKKLLFEKFREFHYESGKKSGNFVITFISYYYDFSKRNLLAPSALAYYKDLLKMLVHAVGSRVLTKTMAC